MSGRTLYALTALLAMAACSTEPGSKYVVEVRPNSLSEQQATRLELNVRRLDTSDATRVTFDLPTPRPKPPWLFDLETRSWGSTAIVVEATARDGQTEFGTGTGKVVAGSDTITVVLKQALPADGGVTDLQAVSDGGASSSDGSVQDLGAVRDLAPSKDLSTSPADLAGCVTHELSADQDTQLSPNTPTTNLGEATALKIGFEGSVGLVHFPAIPQLDLNVLQLSSLRLTMTAAGEDEACGSMCSGGTFQSGTMCTTEELAGDLEARLMTNDWKEAEATWTLRTMGFGWTPGGAAPAASGTTGSDSTPFAFAIAKHQPGQADTFEAKPTLLADLRTWFGTYAPIKGFSIRLASVTGAGMTEARAVYATSERAMSSAACGTRMAPKLQVTFCPK
jgi:hypothetical protein